MPAVATIRLLGRPALETADGPAPVPRGSKAWGLLAYLLLAERPATRRELAALLFPAADDPLAALRWSLAELRRTLGAPAGLRGDPPRLELDPATVVDIQLPAADAPVPRAWLERLTGELLEGLVFPGCPAFEAWLSIERRRLAAAAEALLHETALAALAGGRPEEAVRLAARVVGLNPLDECNQELLVRSLALSGDRTAALAQAERCDALFRRELGVPPSPAVRRAAYAAEQAPVRPPTGGRAAAAGQLEAGQAAAAAGAVEAAVERLRRACAEAAAAGDQELRGRALFALGTTLVRAVRGRDEEGAAVLHHAIAVAGRAGDRATSAAAHRELGYIDVQAGRRERAEHWLAAAEELAEGDAELAAVLGVRGMNDSDRADYGPALARLTESAERAHEAGSPRQAAWSLSLVGRLHLLRGDDDAALAAIDRCLELVEAERWVAFRSWPEALRAEVEARAGALDVAAERLERAFSVACQVEDPCWEGVTARGIGLLEARRGRPDAARAWLTEAVGRCTRVPDRYEWAHAYVLDGFAAAAADGPGREAAERLHALAARTGMRELVVRALVHLGGEETLASARLLARDIDNPALDALLARAG
jgi:DNA-binding SARP family transcriptional activator